MATSFTAEDITRMERAITNATRSVTFSDGRRIDFSTFEEMVNRLNFMKQELGLEGGRQRLLAKFRKGVN